MKKLIIVLLCFLLTFQISAQKQKILEPKQLKKDFQYLISLIEAHPAPYRHLSEKEMHKLIDETRSELNQPMDVLQFFKLTSPIIGAIRDGHTSVGLPQGWLTKHLKAFGVFPYKVYISEGDRLYIIDSYQENPGIPLGSEILMLNNVPAASFIKEISHFISYEQDIFRNTIIEQNFDLYLLLFFGEISQVDIQYLSDKKHTQKIDFVTYDIWKNRDDVEYEEKRRKLAQDQPYAYKKVQEGVGLLKIYSFAVQDQRKYSLFLREMFRKISQDEIQSLIIDVRGNTGGYPKIVSELLHWITDKHFKTMAQSETKVSKVYKKYFQNLAPSLNFYQARFHRLPHTIDINRLFGYENGTLFKEDAYNEAPKEMYHEFTGDLYLLTDRRSYSASSSFAATFRCYQLGLIIGTETGGTKIFHANSMYHHLRHSGLSCSMATVRDYTTCYLEENEGIKPDLEAKPTVLDLVAKRDAAMAYTLHVIKKVKKMRAED